MNKNIVVTILNERKAALTLDMCDIAVDVDAALDLHLLQHRVDQNVNSHRFGAATEKTTEKAFEMEYNVARGW